MRSEIKCWAVESSFNFLLWHGTVSTKIRVRSLDIYKDTEKFVRKQTVACSANRVYFENINNVDVFKNIH